MSTTPAGQTPIVESDIGDLTPSSRLVVSLVAVTLPELALAVLGVFHPMDLNNGDMEWYRTLHVIAAFLFPLVGVAPWVVTYRQPIALRLIVGMTAFMYAVLYVVFDVLAGIGTTYIQSNLYGTTARVRENAENVLNNGAFDYQAPAMVALMVSVLITIVSVIITLVSNAISVRGTAQGRRRVGAWARVGGAIAAGVALIVGVVEFDNNHIFFPLGVIGQLLLAAGSAALLLLKLPRHHPAHEQPPATSQSAGKRDSNT